jgi:hypothetical protein
MPGFILPGFIFNSILIIKEFSTNLAASCLQDSQMSGNELPKVIDKSQADMKWGQA